MELKLHASMFAKLEFLLCAKALEGILVEVALSWVLFVRLECNLNEKHIMLRKFQVKCVELDCLLECDLVLAWSFHG